MTAAREKAPHRGRAVPGGGSARVDVLMPVRDAAETLPGALDDVLGQTLGALRLLAVDDHSRDESRTLLARRSSGDPRVVVLSNRGRGLVDALNTGLAAARAPLVARFDADDRMAPERIERQTAALAADPRLGCVGCRARYEGPREGFRAYVAWSNALCSPAAIRRNRFVESPLIHPTVLFRRELVARYGGYAATGGPEDYELWLRWMAQGVRIGKVPRLLVTWRDAPTRLTRVDPRYDMEAFFAVKTPYLARWLAGHNPYHPALVVWGAGRRSRLRARRLEALGVRITAFVDIDPRKTGNRLHGRPVWRPDELPEPGRCFVATYVSNRGAREEIRETLCRRGYREERDFICAA